MERVNRYQWQLMAGCFNVGKNNKHAIIPVHNNSIKNRSKSQYQNSLWPWNAIWQHRSGSILTLALQWHQNGISNHWHLDCLRYCLFRHRSEKISKLHATGLCEGNPPVTGGFPSQKASNVENSIWRHHYGLLLDTIKPNGTKPLTWNNVNKSSVRFCGIQMRIISILEVSIYLWNGFQSEWFKTMATLPWRQWVSVDTRHAWHHTQTTKIVTCVTYRSALF